MVIEEIDNPFDWSVVVLFHLGKHSVARHKSYLHTRKVGGEKHCKNYTYNQTCLHVLCGALLMDSRFISLPLVFRPDAQAV